MIKVNFQCTDDDVPDGYLADSGGMYASRGSYEYGWDCDQVADDCRNRGASIDLILDSLVIPDRSGGCTTDPEWSVAVSSGVYHVELDFGDPVYGPGTLTGCSLQGEHLGSIT